MLLMQRRELSLQAVVFSLESLVRSVLITARGTCRSFSTQIPVAKCIPHQQLRITPSHSGSI